MATALPTHPTLTHPITGLPLRAVFVSERTGRVYWPVLGGAPEGDGGDGGNSGEGNNGASGSGDGGQQQNANDHPEFAFPDGVPVAEMTGEQQSEYWRHKAQKHEKLWKSAQVSPQQLAELREKAERADALDAEFATDAEKREKAARDAAVKEADAKYQPQLVETAFHIAIGDRKTEQEVSDFVADLNLPRFLTADGKVDTAKVLERVQQFAPATGNGKTPKGPTVTGHGAGGGGTAGDKTGASVSDGSDLYDRLHPQKTQKTA